MDLRWFRKQANLTQVELARRVGVTQTYISELETGKKDSPSLRLLSRIAAELGVTIPELLTKKAS